MSRFWTIVKITWTVVKFSEITAGRRWCIAAESACAIDLGARPRRSHEVKSQEGRSYDEWKDLAGRKALVTGGARGIGAAIAEALASAGASVMIGDILAELGSATAAASRRQARKTGFVELDVTDDAQWEQAVAATVATLGGYDILINNAGIEITSLISELKAEDVRRMCDVNIVGTVLGMKHAFRAMRPGGGRQVRRRRRQHRLGCGDDRVPGHRGLFGHQIRG